MSFTKSAKAMIEQMDWTNDHDRILEENKRRYADERERLSRLSAELPSKEELQRTPTNRREPFVKEGLDAALRSVPWSDSPQVERLKSLTNVTILGFAYGENLRGNNLWFQTGKGWIWSGSVDFSMIDTRNLQHFPNPLRRDPRDKRDEKRLDVALNQNERKLLQETLGLSVTRPNHFASAFESALTPTAERARRQRNPYAEQEARDRQKEAEREARERSRAERRKLLHSREEERDIQAAMSYRVGPHPWFVGYRLIVDRADGKTQVFWRPTDASAHATGHKVLEKQVRRRQRLWEAANPKLVTARDRWIIEPTQAEQTAKEQAEWDAQFNEEGKQ